MTNRSAGQLSIRACMALTCLALWSAGVTATAAEPDWKVGLASVKITPEQPLPMSGYGGRTKPFEKVAADLFVKAMVLEDTKGQRAALVTSDLLGLPRDVAEPICAAIQMRTGLKREFVLLNSSHTHAGPELALKVSAKDASGEALRTVEYTRQLQNKVVEAVVQAAARLEPAHLSWSSGVVHFVMNRREFTPGGVILGVNPRGLADRTVPVLRVDGANGKPRAVLFGAAVHGTTLGPDNYQLCGDYAGFAQAAIQERYPNVQAMFMLGCAGDANPYPRGTMELTRQHGKTLADEVCRVLDGKFRPVRGPLQIAFGRADLPLASLSREQMQKLAANKRGAQAYAAGAMLAMLERGEKPPTSYACPFTVWQFGQDLTLAGLPGEVVVDYVALLEKALGPNQLWLAGYCNDVFGYLPSARVVSEGGYETRGLYAGSAGIFDAKAEGVVVETVRALAGQAGRKMPTEAQQTSTDSKFKPAGAMSNPGNAEPVITVTAVYPGASAQVVADLVASPIEQQINGVEGMRYMSSRSDNDGTYLLAVRFKNGVDLDAALNLVQNRLSLALQILPNAVTQAGLTVRKKPPGVLMFAALTSPDNRYDSQFLSNYAAIYLHDELTRLAGVSDVKVLGANELDLRITINLTKLEARKLTVSEIVRALQKHNAKIKAEGADKPTVERAKGEAFQLTITSGPLFDVEELAELVVKSDGRGGIVRVKDVASVELGATANQNRAFWTGKPAVVLAFYPTSNARPREVSTLVKKKLTELAERFPKGIRVDIAFDFSANRAVLAPGSRDDYLLVEVDIPSSFSKERAFAVLKKAEKLLIESSGIKDALATTENPFESVRDRPCILLRVANAGTTQPAGELLARIVRASLAHLGGVRCRLTEISASGGVLEPSYPIHVAIHGPEREKVSEWAKKLSSRLHKNGKLSDLWLNPESVPQIHLDIDREKSRKLGVNTSDVNSTLQAYLGLLDMSFPEQFGRRRGVIMRTDANSGKRLDDLKQLKIRAGDGHMVVLSDFVKIRETQEPRTVYRFDALPAVIITANPAYGVSSTDGRASLEKLAAETRAELGLTPEYRLTTLRISRDRLP